MSSRDLFTPTTKGERDGQAQEASEAQAQEVLICAGCARASAVYDFARDCCLIRWVSGHVNKKAAAEWVANKYGEQRAARLRAKWTEIVRQIQGK